MTIHSLDIPALHKRLQALEEAENLTHDQRSGLDAIDEAIESVRTIFKGHGFVAPGDDRARALEAVIFWFLFEGNPGEHLSDVKRAAPKD